MGRSPAKLIIRRPASVDRHQFQNFGEALWKAAKEQDWGTLSLDEVDNAYSEIAVTIPTPSPKHIERAREKIEHHLKRHRVSDAEIIVTEDMDR